MPGDGARSRSVSTASLLTLCFTVALCFAAPGFAETTPRVLEFAPAGTVKNVRQVTARFSEAMVPLGQPFDAAPPFVIACPEKGSGRWLDTTRWAYDFARDLPAGIRCTFRVREGLKTLAGQPLTTRQQYQFDTGGPAIVEAQPWDGNDGIDEQQAF